MNLKNINLPSKIMPELAELIGIHFGDGGINVNNQTYTVHYTFNAIKDKDFSKYFFEQYNKIFDIKLIRCREIRNNAVTFHFRSKKLCEYLRKEFGLPWGRKNELSIPKPIRKNKTFLLSFLRGVFDTDGCFSYKRDRNYIYLNLKISTKSLKFAKEIEEELINLGFRARVDKKADKRGFEAYDVVLHGINQCTKWMNLISSKNPRNYLKYEEFKMGM